jgi:molecular chaperone GrpE
MANETEVESDISGVDNWLEEGGPVEPQDLEDDTTAERDELAVTQMALAERTADLQRLQAEFLNYKRRVDRDRDLIRENATFVVLTPIIDVLDNIDRAREHGPLEGGFNAVAEQLERIVSALGLTKFGEPGDAFDPTIHEALSHIGEDPEVVVPTAKVVAKAGYKIGDRVVRAAQVLVVDPASS